MLLMTEPLRFPPQFKACVIPLRIILRLTVTLQNMLKSLILKGMTCGLTCNPGSSPNRVAVICELSCLFILSCASRVCLWVFLPLKNQLLNSIVMQWQKSHSVETTVNSHQFLYLNLFFKEEQENLPD